MAGMLFATSCSEEEVLSQSTGNEVKVTFTTQLRNDVKSRAVGDDTDGIDQLEFAVYNENDEHLPLLNVTVPESQFTRNADGTTEASVEVILVKGQTYSFAFWAQDANYTAYDFDASTATVSIDYGQIANNKLADAFFASVNDYKVTGTFEMDVTLKRPFAQVNFLTTQYDLDKADAAGFVPSESSIVVQNAATSLNVLDGSVAGNAEAAFTINELISDETTNIKNASGSYITWDATNTKFSSSSNAQYACNFKYLATAYFLPTEATSVSTITASMSVAGNTSAPVELTAEGINAQRNYRTNIYGNLLTNNGKFYITVDPGFTDDYNKEEEEPTTTVVATIEQANQLFEEGKTNVEIQQAPTSDATLTLPSTTDDVTINFAFEEGSTPAKVTIDYNSNGDKPQNISINGNGGDLDINTEESTATVNGNWTSVTASTADNTLIVPKGVTIGTLTLNKGNAEIYYGAVTELVKSNGYNGKITWTVDSKEQLAEIATEVNNGSAFDKESIKLINDIDLNNEEWTPIGNSDHNFQGTFDGDNHIVSNLTITGYNSNVGLFGVTTNGEIKNLTVNNAKVSGRLKVGVVAGTPYTSKYTNIKVTGHVEVNGMAYVGGVGGKDAYANWTGITVDVDADSYVYANSVENGTAYRTYVGGVVGFNGEGGHSFTNISSNIDVKGSTCDVGGLFGIAHYSNKFENCVCTGDVEIYNAAEAVEAEEIGGIAGVWNNATGYTVTFTSCSFTGTLKANLTEGVDLTNNTIVGNSYSADGGGTLNIDGDLYKVAFTCDMLKSALSSASGNTTITLMGDIEGDVTVTQKENVNITIDGQNYTYDGTIVVDGKSARYETAGLTIQNVNFSAESISAAAYINLGKSGDSSTRYTNNVTVKDCTFSTTSSEDVVAVKSYTGGDWNLNIGGCTVNEGMHSMLQVTNVEKGLNIVGCKVYSKNGINLNNTPALEMTDCTFNTKGYAIRVGVNGNTNNGVFNISKSTLESACEDGDAVIILRGNMAGSTLNLTNTTVTGTTQYTNESGATVTVK